MIRSRRKRSQQGTDLGSRLSALQEARNLADGRLGGDVLSEADQVLARAASRRALSADHTVAGFFGATGSGKSSLLNAVVGQELARTAARRPTTAEPLAAIWGEPGSGELLDWLGVADRHPVDDGEEGLILLDLPDFDSVAPEHRAISERLSGMVDVLVWVLDPQKYADDVIHHDFIRPFSTHGAVTLVVLNQIDLVAPTERGAVLSSLEDLLARDGLRDAEVLAASALTGSGVDDVRAEIRRVADSRQAAGARLAADARRAAEAIAAASGTGEAAGNTPARTQGLVDGLSRAARVEEIADAAAASYRRRNRARTGWPVLRWVKLLRVDPLARLNIGQGEAPTDLARTSMPSGGAPARAHADSAVRSFADAVSDGAPESWRGAIRRAARASSGSLPDALDQAVARTDVGAKRGSWWWYPLDVIQWLALACAVLGLAWYGLGAALLAAFGTGLPAAPQVPVEAAEVVLPLPTVMIVVGVAAGVLLALLGAAIGVVVGAARRARIRRRLRAAVTDAARQQVVTPVDQEVERYETFRHAVATARG